MPVKSVSELVERTVYVVASLEGFPSQAIISTVNRVDVTSPSIYVTYPKETLEIGSNGLHPTSYVRTVMYRLPLDGVESLSTKCPTEKTVTDQEFVLITPVDEGDADPMQLLKLTKRLVLCTSCGSLRLIN